MTTRFARHDGRERGPLKVAASPRGEATDLFERGNGPLGRRWHSYHEPHPLHYDPAAIDNGSVGAGSTTVASGRAGAIQDPIPAVLPVGIRLTRSGADFSQIGPVLMGRYDNSDEWLGISAYYNVLFGRYYIVVLTESGRNVWASLPSNVGPGGFPTQHEIRFDGTNIELWVDNVRSIGPFPVPSGSPVEKRRYGWYQVPAGGADVTQITGWSLHSGVSMGSTPVVPSIISTASQSAASSSGFNITLPTWTDPLARIYIWLAATGGGTLTDPLGVFGTALMDQTTSAGGLISRVWQSAANVAAFSGLSLPVGKTGGSAGGFGCIIWIGRDLNVAAACSGSQQENSASTSVPAPSFAYTGRYHQGIYFAVSSAGAITQPPGWASVDSEATGLHMRVARIDLPGHVLGAAASEVETAVGSMASSGASIAGTLINEMKP